MLLSSNMQFLPQLCDLDYVNDGTRRIAKFEQQSVISRINMTIIFKSQNILPIQINTKVTFFSNW